MSDKPFDPTKPCRTRDGRAARIICTDAKGEPLFPVVALVAAGGANEALRRYSSTGRPLAGPPDDDLVNVPKRASYWHKIVADSVRFSSYWTPDLESCRAGSARRASAYLEIIFEDERPVAVNIHPGDEPAPAEAAR